MCWPSGGRPVVLSPSVGPVSMVRAAAAIAATSTWASTVIAAVSICASSVACSCACTSPRWRDGSLSASTRGTAPSTATRASASARRSIVSCRGEPTRLRMTPATCRSARQSTKPWTSGAIEWPVRLASTTSTTGRPRIAARSPAEPRPFGGAPSNRPIAPSTSSRSLRDASARSRSVDIAQASRLTQHPRAAAARNCGSM